MSAENIFNELNDLKNKIEDIKNLLDNEKEKEFLPVLTGMETEVNTLLVDAHDKNKKDNFLGIARHPKRPTTLDYVDYIFTDFIEFHGDRRFSEDPSVVGGVAYFDGIPVTVIGTQKGRDTKESIKRNFGYPNPEGYRKALRLMQQAEKFRRPIINFIDTPGAYPGLGAEERGQGEAIALNLYEMSTLKTPIISIITGEGGSGGALALGVANKVFMLSNAYYSVITPEGCASILWKDAGRVQDAVGALKIDSGFLFKEEIIEEIIEEPLGGAHTDHQTTAENIREKLRVALKDLLQYDEAAIVEQRLSRFRKFGKYEQAAL